MFDPWVVLSNLSDPVTLLLMTLSACFGIIMGAVPGLSGTLGIALLLPFTFGLESATALLMLGSVYCGSESVSYTHLKLLGVHIAGAHASDLIAEATFALQKGCSARGLFETIHAHPTLSEGLYEAAGMLA